MFALATIFMGTTFISTKILLRQFQPIGDFIFPVPSGLLGADSYLSKEAEDRRLEEEKYFTVAGLCNTLYYLFENIALTYTMVNGKA